MKSFRISETYTERTRNPENKSGSSQTLPYERIASTSNSVYRSDGGDHLSFLSDITDAIMSHSENKRVVEDVRNQARSQTGGEDDNIIHRIYLSLDKSTKEKYRKGRFPFLEWMKKKIEDAQAGGSQLTKTQEADRIYRNLEAEGGYTIDRDGNPICLSHIDEIEQWLAGYAEQQREWARIHGDCISREEYRHLSHEKQSQYLKEVFPIFALMQELIRSHPERYSFLSSEAAEQAVLNDFARLGCVVELPGEPQRRTTMNEINAYLGDYQEEKRKWRRIYGEHEPIP